MIRECWNALTWGETGTWFGAEKAGILCRDGHLRPRTGPRNQAAWAERESGNGDGSEEDSGGRWRQHIKSGRSKRKSEKGGDCEIQVLAYPQFQLSGRPLRTSRAIDVRWAKLLIGGRCLSSRLDGDPRFLFSRLVSFQSFLFYFSYFRYVTYDEYLL